MPNPAAVKSPPPAPPAAPQAFRLVPTPRQAGKVEEPSASNQWATGWSHQQHEIFSTLMAITASAEIPGFGLIHRIASECGRPGCRAPVTRYMAESVGTPSAHEPCPRCEFEALAATARAEFGSAQVLTPDAFDLVRAEKAAMARDYPAIFEALAAAGSLPPDTPHVQGGPLKWCWALACHPSPGCPYVDTFRPLKDGTFGAGDFGVYGKLDDARLDDAGRFYVDMLDQLHKNALAIERGFGVIKARYPVEGRERVAHLAFHRPSLLENSAESARPPAPRTFVEVVALLSDGECSVVCRPRVTADYDRE